MSDIVLFLTIIGVVTEARLLISMAAIGGLVLELGWGVIFVFSVFYDRCFSNFTSYMFDACIPFGVRFLSLFHVVLPFLLIWLVAKLGYVRAAFPLQTLLVWIVLFTSWLITDPAKNINHVFCHSWLNLSPFTYILILSLFFSLIFYATHRFLMTLKKR